MNNKLLIFGPGFGDPNVVIDQLAKKFNKGFDRIVLSYPDRGTRISITDICDDLYDPLSMLCRQYKFVGFVGHSMGGLVGRRLMFLSGDEKLFDAYVSIASPHSGTRLVSLLPRSLVERLSPSAADMRPGSNFLRLLDEVGVPKDIPCMTIAAALDTLVWPSSSTRIKGVKDHVTIPKTSHLTVALSNRTFLEIWGWLTYGILGEISPGETPGRSSHLRVFPPVP